MAHMDVLLCEDIDNLGQRGQVVRVRAGYGRNYLLPQKLAIKATSGNKRMIDEQRRILNLLRELRRRAVAENYVYPRLARERLADLVEHAGQIGGRRHGEPGLLPCPACHAASDKGADP